MDRWRLRERLMEEAGDRTQGRKLTDAETNKLWELEGDGVSDSPGVLVESSD